ncbi:MAG: o-succinylbenzoate synthase [Anaerolineae bacterium]|nr:o-succinylbenzoate synthase [Anaerolineae bacterium]
MMRITAIPYTLQFKRPAMTSRGALHARPVVFLRAGSDGVIGWGECGPVPCLSPDDRPDFPDVVQSVCDRINAGAPTETIDLSGLPSLAFGLETALRDLETGGRQQLFNTPFARGKSSLATHGLVWIDTPDAMLAQIEAKIAAGCRVVKMKVGALPLEQELALLAEFRRRWPPDYVELRLDANGAWQSVEQALVALEQLAAFDPSFVEQPLPAGRWADTAAVCARSPVPIALDEELIGAVNPAQLLDAIQPQHLVLKPSLLGGLAACETWIVEAAKRGIQWWINSLLESNVGLNAIAQWTSARDTGRVHGLGTGRLFTNNIPSPLRLDGCGLRLDPDSAWIFKTLWSEEGGWSARTFPHPNPLPKRGGTGHSLLPLPLGEGWGEGESALPANFLTVDENTYQPADLVHLDPANLPTNLSENARATLLFCRDWLRGRDEFLITTSGSPARQRTLP